MDGRVGGPGVRREVDVILADGVVEVGVVVVVVVGIPGVTILAVDVEIALETDEESDDSTDVIVIVVLDNIVGDGAVEDIALVADAEVELATAEEVTGPAVVVTPTGVSVVEETGRRGVEEVEMSGPETDVDGTVTLAAVEGAADSVRATVTEEDGDKEDIDDLEVETAEELDDSTDVRLTVVLENIVDDSVGE